MKHDCRISGHVETPCGPYVTLKEGGFFSSSVYDLRANIIDDDYNTYVGNYYYLQECKCRYCGCSLGLCETDKAPKSVIKRYAEYCVANGMEFIGMPGESKWNRSDMWWLPEEKTPSFLIPKVTVRDKITGRAISGARIEGSNVHHGEGGIFVGYTDSNGFTEMPTGFLEDFVHLEIEAPGYYSLRTEEVMSKDNVYYLNPRK